MTAGGIDQELNVTLIATKAKCKMTFDNPYVVKCARVITGVSAGNIFSYRENLSDLSFSPPGLPLHLASRGSTEVTERQTDRQTEIDR